MYRVDVPEPRGIHRRLLLVSDTLAGGTGAAVLGHAKWFLDNGWDVSVAAPGGETDAVAVPGHRPMDMPVTVRQVAGVIRTARSLHRISSAFRPDVVHCHGARSFAITRLMSRRAPFVTLHSISPVSSDPPGYARLRRPALALLPALAARAFAVRPDAPRGWEFLPHASPRLATMALLPPPSATVPTFLWIGRLDEPKRPDLFVSAMVALAARCPGVRGLVAGSGPLEAAVASQIQDAGAPVVLLGHVGEISHLLLEAWAVVLFSDAEGVNFALEEAMWSGRPVVGSAVPGTAWLVGPDREAGAALDTVEEAVDVLSELCHLDQACALGGGAAARIRRLLGPHDPWPAVERAYEEHLAGTGAGHDGSRADPDHR